jgi:curved DNA-binding protein
VRLAGQGSPGAAGASAGDLYLVVEVAPHPDFVREGDDLRAEVRVDFYTAALGGEARVRTIDGAVTLKVPPGTQADRTFRLKGKGMPRLGRPGERGDMWARVKLVLPETMSDAEIEGLRKLAEARTK